MNWAGFIGWTNATIWMLLFWFDVTPSLPDWMYIALIPVLIFNAVCCLFERKAS